MATYVQGYKMYDREATPFVPDYKFLSNVLSTRQTRYDQNYKAINDAYSRVVFADLSKEENKEKRDQFAQQIAPKMAQISGYDLSLRQNADMAAGVFAPFYEDDNIVRDLTNTANYKFGTRYADALSRSPDKSQRDLWWQPGVDHLNMQMEKYLAASPEEALNMTIGKYTPNPNLYEYSLALLDEQGFSVEKDILTEDGRWIVKQKNGDLVTDQAYAYLNRALMDDPRVINGYRVKSEVDAYNFAKNAVQNGEFANFAQAEEFWARDTIDKISTQAALELGEDKKKAEEMGDMAARWEEYNAKYDFPEGHSSEKIANDFKSRYKALILGVEDKRNIINMGINAESTNKDLMNQAFMMYMGVNIQKDLAAAAKSYSMKDFKMEIDTNPYGLAKYNAELKSILQREKAELDKRNIDYENALIQQRNNSLLINESGAGGIDISNISDDGKVVTTSPNLQMDAEAMKRYLEQMKSDQVDFVLKYHQLSEGLKDGGDAANIVINGNTMSMDQAKTFLSQPGNSRFLKELYESAATTVKTENSFPEADLSNANKDLLRQLRLVPGDLNKREARYVALKEMQFDAAFNNYNALLQIPKGYGKDLVNLKNKGIPNIFNNEILLPPGVDAVSGADTPAPTSILSEEEYITKYVNWARGRNIHTKRVADGTTTSFSSPTTGIGTTSTNYKTVFSPEKAEKKAKEYYQEQVKYINATLNGAIDIHRNDKGDENFVSPFKRFSFVEGSIGISSDQMTGASANMVSGQKNQFNPQVTREGDEAYYDFKTLVAELNQGTNIISIERGSVLNKDNMSGEIDQMSKNLLIALSSEVTQWLNAPRDTNGNIKTTGLGKNPTFDIQYMGILGGARDENKQAGYIVNMNNDFISETLTSYGYEKDEIRTFLEEQDGTKVSVIVDKRFDMNSRSLNNVQDAVSDVNASINLSGNNSYIFDDYSRSGGYLKVYSQGAQFFYEFQTKTFNSDTGEFEVDQRGAGVPLVDGNNVPIPLTQLDAVINALEIDFYNISQRNEKAEEAYLKSKKNK
tara:strand:+ start:2946 stop:6035 length:3090 start_codon:yes stop_codon:yes gene_type:complete